MQSYNLDYEEIGIFGSYARGDYKSTSDIDFCIIVKERPSHYISIYIIRNVWLQPAG
ncbi:nucleotidyltransferase domain-containing protein [Anaerobutyricum hallii]|uniref:nucleotidyltransferase family protein n=1 Tax=Anaerobutyricum hallii TaxID=39488 RepID=UPI0009EA5299|nr:nucleotidyltransferase domain-containing protein [Anaerobutyricum hallii]